LFRPLPFYLCHSDRSGIIRFADDPAKWRNLLLSGLRRTLCFAELVSRTVQHLARDARILDHNVAVREALPLLFLVF
jgi:hypothetical protein